MGLLNFSQASLENKLNQTFDTFRVRYPGLTTGRIMITKGSSILLDKSFGKNIKPDSQFMIASISKHITAAAVLRCVERGQLDLQASLRRYFPKAGKWADKVTLHHLLTHTSGLPDHTEEWDTQKSKKFTLKEVLEFIESHPFQEQEVGKTYRYNNTGYFLASALVEKASAKPFDVFLKEEFFEPLEMKDTCAPLEGKYPDLIKKKELKKWVESSHNGRLVTDIESSFLQGAGGVVSTVPDMIKWGHSLFREKKVLSPSSLKNFLKSHTTYKVQDLLPVSQPYYEGQNIGDTPCGQGYGIRTVPFGGQMTQYSHSGRIDGFQGDFRYIPSKSGEGYLIVGFSNLTISQENDSMLILKLINEFANVIYQEEYA